MDLAVFESNNPSPHDFRIAPSDIDKLATSMPITLSAYCFEKTLSAFLQLGYFNRLPALVRSIYRFGDLAKLDGW